MAPDSSIIFELRKYVMFMAILTATVTYVAGLNPPGGVWLRTEDDHLAGNQILVVTDHQRYNAFYYSNGTAFMASVVAILLLLLLERKMDKLRLLVVLRYVMVLDLFALLVAYTAGASRGTATTVFASMLASKVFVYVTGYAAPHLLGSIPDHDELSLEAKSRLVQRRKILILFCIFAATVTYTAGLNPPGGFWADAKEAGHRPGSPVMHSRRFMAFFICNTVTFIASLMAMLMLLTTIRSEFRQGAEFAHIRRWWYVLYGEILATLLGLLVAYALGSCRKTHSTIYVFCLVLPVLLYTLIQLLIQRYCWDKLVGLAKKIQRHLTCCWTGLSSGFNLCWNGLRSCWTDPIQQNARRQDNSGTGTAPAQMAHTMVLLLATLAVTITYQAGMNPPGGFWPDDGDGHKGGDPILLTTHLGRYRAFFYCNTVALVASIVVIFMVLNSHVRIAVHKHHALEAAMLLDLLSLTAAYAVGCGRDVDTSLRLIAVGGAILAYVVIHIVFFTLETTRSEEPAVMKKKRKLLLLFAILVVTITYQAGLTPPGSFWLKGDSAGYPVISSNYPGRYTAFFYCNAASFMSSVVIIILLVNPHMYELGIKCHALYLCAVSGLVGLISAYAAGSSRHMRTSIFVVALAGAVVVFIVLLLLALKFLFPTPAAAPDPEATQPASVAPEQETTAPATADPDATQPATVAPEQETTAPAPAAPGQETIRPAPAAEGQTDKYTRRKCLMLVSILVASVTYQAGLNPPGGVWPDSIDGHAAGGPVLHDSNKRRYHFFFYSNSVSFLAAIVVIFLLQLDELLGVGSEGLLRVAQSSILLALLGLLFAYASGSSREWDTFGHMVALTVVVLLYIAIHVLLSCRHDNSSHNPSADRSITRERVLPTDAYQEPSVGGMSVVSGD
ncbi:hypothetical protein CFC21_085723 [Triticum aestivum]|uniref:PGG domain-containing protein n=2 Tax=Triticum aestivum TaxID=4565 RepID=A0A9R1ICT4_WHEAT|nr:uncharacterized protein LOC123133024 [Triticum aestivum]KAF7081813.1 hypothetical protein CFC21_085723 [Triticum aestivum]